MRVVTIIVHCYGDTPEVSNRYIFYILFVHFMWFRGVIATDNSIRSCHDAHVFSGRKDGENCYKECK